MSGIESQMTRLMAGGVLALGLALPLAAQDGGTGDRVTAEEVQAELDEAFETIGEYSAEQREEALAAVRETLDEIDSEIARLEQRARENWADMSEATQEQTRETLEELRDRRNRLSEAYGAMRQGTQSAWDEVQEGVASAWSELKDAWDAAVGGSGNGN